MMALRRINYALLFGGLFGFLAITLGAYADHGLRATLALQDFTTLMTALRYQLVHAALLAVLGLVDRERMARRAVMTLNCVTACFVIGTLLFCGSLIIASIGHEDWIIHAAPIGGLTLMTGWLGLVALAFMKWRSDNGPGA